MLYPVIDVGEILVSFIDNPNEGVKDGAIYPNHPPIKGKVIKNGAVPNF